MIEKRYTAQEMRNMQMYVTCLNKDQERTIKSMLRQAADAAEENAQLKARLDAVQKSLDKHQDCHECKSYPHCDGSGCICAVVEISNILSAARGEGGAE